MNLLDSRKQLNRILSDYQHARRTAKEEKANLTKVEQRTQDVLTAQRFLQEVAKTTQEVAHRQISSVVSRCLQTVFGEEAYTFHIEFEEKRGKTEARLQFKRDGLVLEKPLKEAGGGQCDVSCFGLRLACLMISLPRKRKSLFLDEPFRYVSKEYRENVRGMVESLAKELKIQFVLVTHSPELVMGKVVEL